MTLLIKARMASVGIAMATAIAAPAMAADLGDGGWGRGSIKDYSPAPIARAPAGPCYVRADVGYSISNDPRLTWNAVDSSGNINQGVSNTSLGDGWLYEAGLGCGSGSRGFRTDFTLGYHGDRDVSGTTGVVGGSIGAQRIVSSLQTYTSMINLYYDFGMVGSLVPYVGAGVGLAYNRAADYSFPNLIGPAYAVHGDNDLSLAWSIMAGVGYQISDRAILDFGYRYIDMGSAATARNDVNGQAQVTRLSMSDINAHEFKVGLRYHFGADGFSLK